MTPDFQNSTLVSVSPRAGDVNQRARGSSFYVFVHWFLIALLSVVMAMIGFHFLYQAKWAGVVEDTLWVIWYSAVSLVTWSLIWLYARKKSWADWIVYGLISPFIGCVLFFPITPLAFLTVFEFCWIVFPVGIVTGGLAAAISSPFQKRYALNKKGSNAS